MNLAILVKALNFLFAFKHIFDTCLSNHRLLSIVTPRPSTPLLSQTLSLSNFALKYSFLFPDIKR